ncbi:MAG: alpha-xylosidase [Treponema sp.]|nr:alpha-xylosidase [Treponema sp.]
MKFTNGFWLTRKEYEADYAKEIYKWDSTSDSLTLFAPYKKINTRGDTLNLGLSTINVTAPIKDVLKIRITGHQGAIKKGPFFDLENIPDYKEVKVAVEKEEASIKSGLLELKVSKGSPFLTFLKNGCYLTKTGTKGIARIKRRDDGTVYTAASLMLDVGEHVYGLGERFTPYVKNGQNVDCWNEDGGTASEISYKNIPFYMTDRNYGVFVNHPGKVSFEVASEKVEDVQFSVKDEALEFFIIAGENQKDVLSKYTLLTGRAPLLPKWSFGLWLTTSFTTNYNEETVTSFVDGMAQRKIPLRVFHFDCFWMKEFEWCNFTWDKDMFPDPEGMLKRLHNKGLKICVWINPYIAQKSPLFKEAEEYGYLLKNINGTVWQWDMWQAGMGLVDFTNENAWKWYQSKLKALMDMGVDCFKTDFGERIPSSDDGYNIQWESKGDDEKMHNYYTYLYNKCVYEIIKAEKGEGEAILFARSATAGSQKFPVHWGGDSTSQYVSMAESLRAGLSLMDSGFAFWSHDIGGFEDTGSADLYKRWCAFGLFSTHSRLHGSSSYRVPWVYDEEACDVLRFFVQTKCKLMPYIYSCAIESHYTGIPVMRPMHLEFPEDMNCATLDMQYMLGDSILVAPVFTPSKKDSDGVSKAKASCYLPEGTWTHLLSGKKIIGGKWYTDEYDYYSLPVFVKEGSVIPFGTTEDKPDYDYTDNIVWHIYPSYDGKQKEGKILSPDGNISEKISVIAKEDGSIDYKEIDKTKKISVIIEK